jgi:hypothetical protein
MTDLPMLFLFLLAAIAFCVLGAMYDHFFGD